MNRVRRAAVAAALVGTLLLAGCATMTNGARGDVARAAAEAASSAQTAVLALGQRLDDGSTTSVTGTTLADMLDELQTTETALAELSIGGGGDDEDAEAAALRDRALAVVRECAEEVVAAQQYLAEAGRTATSSPAGALRLVRLRAAADAATVFSDELAALR